MASVKITLLKSFNEIPYLTEKSKVREILGPDFENLIETREKNRELLKSKEIMSLKDTIQALYKEMGKGNFEWPDISEFEEDCDVYPLYQILYDDNKFDAVIIFPDKLTGFQINGVDCSDFELEKILTLSNDFEWEDLTTSWISKKVSVGIFCPDSKRKIYSITFARPGYYSEGY